MRIQPPTAARHPLRAKLLPRSRSRAARPVREEDDLKLFAVSFTAFFVCFYTFLL